MDGQECPSYGEEEDGRGRSSYAGDVDPRRLAGRRFVRFEVKSLVAESQSGIVWRARDTHLQAEVALKIFWPEWMAELAAVARSVLEGGSDGVAAHASESCRVV